MSLNDQTIRTIEEYTNEGHYVHYSLSIPNLVAKQPWPITWDIQTKCDLIPTSWRFQILFRQFPKKHEVTCSVSLKRRDSEKRHMEAFVWISFFDTDGRSLFDSPSRIYCEGMLPGEEMHGAIGERFICGQRLYIDTTIFIRCSHSDNNIGHATTVNTVKDNTDKLFLKDIMQFQTFFDSN